MISGENPGNARKCLRLAFATLKYYPFGGLEKSFLNISKEVIRRGHELTIFCTRWEGERLPGAEIIELPVRALSNHGRLKQFQQALEQEIRKGQFDVLVGFKRMPGLNVYYNGDVCFQHEAANKHGPWYRATRRYRVMASMEAAVFSPEAETHVLYIAQREKEIYQRYYGTQENRFHALPAGIDKKAIRAAVAGDCRARIRGEQGVVDDEMVVVMVGSDFKRKGVDRAINALASFDSESRKKLRLWVVGKGDEAPYRKLAVSLGVLEQTVFWGASSDVPELLASSDLLLHPARAETGGNVILEAMVAGLPVIVSASAGFSFHVERAGGGLLIADEPYQQANLDGALQKVLGDQALRDKFGAGAWDYADREDLYRRPQVATDVIEEVAKHKAAGH